MIGHLAKYLGRFSQASDSASEGRVAVTSFDASEEVKEFGRETLRLRSVALILVFCCIPSAVAFAPFVAQFPNRLVDWIIVSVNASLALAILAVIVANHRFRRKIALGDAG